ncbi:MAG: YaiI/YqxD family protein [bacterium]
MHIWVDADACPKPIKDILFRAAARARVSMTLVSNKPLRTPSSPHVHHMRVAAGLDEADRRILEMVADGDLVVTADVPLAARAVEKGAVALNPRGDLYTEDNIGERLAVRNFMDDLRGGGVNTGGPPVLHRRDLQAFANQLDRWLARQRGDR